MKRIFFLLVLLFSVQGCCQPTMEATEDVPDLISNSVTITSPNGYGSGVIFRNGRNGRAFVWTAAHVVSGLRKIETVIDLDRGESSTRVLFGDVLVSQPLFMNGKRVGENIRSASIVRYADVLSGKEDLALLMIHDPSFGGRGASFCDFLPIPGDSVWHVGSMHGPTGEASVVLGTLSAVGRTRLLGKNDLSFGLIYDQVALPALGGSSGGGVFDRKTGTCIGLITESLAREAECVNCIVPTRVIRQFASRTHCEWAVDRHVPIPDDLGPVSERLIKCPEAPPMGKID